MQNDTIIILFYIAMAAHVIAGDWILLAGLAIGLSARKVIDYFDGRDK